MARMVTAQPEIMKDEDKMDVVMKATHTLATGPAYPDHISTLSFLFLRFLVAEKP